jgi:hypothetical protein
LSRTYYHDFETGRSGFTDGDLPDGPLVEEISALRFYEREAGCACGKAAMDGKRCHLGATHSTLAMTLDDEALQ